mmetsp:Transcript_82608/g.242412  ORF Transcript_82608/g.242412 Transcript_82608/m.242412 type:complete len:279 (-) Transcript_82608:338-1174(-)
MPLQPLALALPRSVGAPDLPAGHRGEEDEHQHHQDVEAVARDGGPRLAHELRLQEHAEADEDPSHRLDLRQVVHQEAAFQREVLVEREPLVHQIADRYPQVARRVRGRDRVLQLLRRLLVHAQSRGRDGVALRLRQGCEDGLQLLVHLQPAAAPVLERVEEASPSPQEVVQHCLLHLRRVRLLRLAALPAVPSPLVREAVVGRLPLHLSLHGAADRQRHHAYVQHHRRKQLHVHILHGVQVAAAVSRQCNRGIATQRSGNAVEKPGPAGRPHDDGHAA